jgi:hypothetical protein
MKSVAAFMYRLSDPWIKLGMSYFDAAPGYFDASSVHPSTSPHHTNFYGDARHDSVSVKTRIIHETASTTATITKLHQPTSILNYVCL